MTGKQDDAAGPLVRNIRAAMGAIDKIMERDDVSEFERLKAVVRIRLYAEQKMEDRANEQLESVRWACAKLAGKDVADLPPDAPPSP